MSLRDYTLGDDGNWYNSDGERVYYWVSPAETDSSIGGGSETQGIGQDLGGYYTESEIKAAWDADDGMGYLKQQTDWNNYWGFISERQGEIQAGNLVDPIQDDYAGQAKADGLASTDANYQANSGRDEEVYYAQVDSNTQLSQQDQMAGWVEQNADLMSKYGIESEFTNDDGDTFAFNGSTYSRAYKAPGVDYGELAGAALVSAFAAGAIAPAIAGGLGGIGGAALPAGVAGPSAPLLSGGVAKGLAAGAASAASQGLLTGKIDPGSVLSSAVIGGLNPGGYVADNYAPWMPNGELQFGGAPPSSFYGGLVSGTVNDVVKNGLANGEFDLQDSLEKGLISGGINSLTNAYEEFHKNSQENLADQLQYNDPYKYPNTEAGRALAMKDALSNPLLNTTDFGALIGDGGLLPFIPRADLTGIRNITDTVGDGLSGLLNGFELADKIKLADGSVISTKGMTEDEITNYLYIDHPVDGLIRRPGTELIGSQTIGLLNNPVVNGITNTLGNLIPEGGLSEDLQTQIQVYGDEWETANPTNKYNQLDPSDETKLYTENGDLTVAGQDLKNDFIETKITNLGSFNYDRSGGLNENYSWSPNPRGDSELWGTLQNIPGLFSQGSNNSGGAITPPKNPDGSTVKPLNFNGEVINPEALVTVDAGGAVLPSNNDSAIRNQNIIDYVDLLNGGLATDSTASATEVDVDTTKDLDKDTASTVSTVSNTSDTSSTNETLSTNTTKTIDKGDVVTTAVVPEVYVDPEVIVPRTTTLSGGGSPPLNLSGNSGKGLPVLWGMLDPYTKFRGYAKKRQDLYSKMMKSLEAKEPGGMLSGRSTFLTPRERELFEAGEFKR